ncbi:fluoride efflux transporter CrcB [Paenibacillus sp. GCM10027626]|uniref:fluoride efflux transporter CrcB n=1 Tax=Paenibacillus sp. GCM10027626 TaxID=3273411 RepID=UPI00362A0AD6
MKNIMIVGLFGMLGASLRYLIGIGMRDWLAAPFPWGTLLINLAGCLLLSLFSAYLADRLRLAEGWRLGIGTGLIGSFTTFSTFSVETIGLMRDGMPGLALLYTLMSMIGGLLFAWLGFSAADRLNRTGKAARL